MPGDRIHVGSRNIRPCSCVNGPCAADSDQGQALLAEAVDVFGPGALVEPPSAEPSPVRAGDPGSFVSTAVPIVLATLFAAGLVAGLFLILRARRGR